MIKATFKRQYKPKGKAGQVNFVYHLSGTQAELAEFETIQGQYYRTDTVPTATGTVTIPVWFSNKFVGDSCDLLKTSNNRFVADTSEFDKANSIVSQYGGSLGVALAEILANRLMPAKGSAPAPREQAKPELQPDPEATDPLDEK